MNLIHLHVSLVVVGMALSSTFGFAQVANPTTNSTTTQEELDWLVEEIRHVRTSKEPDTLNDVLKRLQELGPAANPIIPKLTDFIERPEKYVTKYKSALSDRAVRALLAIHTPETLDPILTRAYFIDEGAFRIRRELPSYGKVLIPILTGPKGHNINGTFMDVLGELGPDAIPALVTMSQHPWYENKLDKINKALFVARCQSSETILYNFRELPADRDSEIPSLVAAVGIRALDPSLDAMDDSDERVNRLATASARAILESISAKQQNKKPGDPVEKYDVPPDVIAILAKHESKFKTLLTGQDKDAAAFAQRTLVVLGSAPASADAKSPAYAKPSPGAKTLPKLQHPIAGVDPSVIDSLASPDLQTREAASANLSQKKQLDPEILPVLQAMLKDEGSTVRANVVLAIGKTGEKGVPLLVTALDDAEFNVFQSAITSMSEMWLNLPTSEARRVAADGMEIALKHPNPRVRATAEGTSYFHSRDAAVEEESAADSLKSTDVKIRRAVAARMARTVGMNVISQKNFQALKTAARDPDVQVRVDVVRALSHAGVKAVPLLSGALNDANPQVWQASLDGMQTMWVNASTAEERRASTSALEAAMKHPNARIRAALADSSYAKSRKPDPAATRPSTAPTTAPTTSPVEPAAGPTSQPTVASLINILTDSDDSTVQKIAAAKKLRSLGPDAIEAQSAIINLYLDTKNRELRQALLPALGAISPSSPAPAMKVLMPALDDADPYVSQAAEIGLAAIGEPAKEAVPKLIERMSKPTGTPMGGTAAAALIKIGEPSVPALIKLTESKKPALDIAAVETLGLIGPKAAPAVPTLIKILHDRDNKLRGMTETVAQALMLIGPAANTALPELLAALQDSKVTDRESIFKATGKLAPRAPKDQQDRAVAVLSSCLDDFKLNLAANEALGNMGPAAAPATPKIVNLLKKNVAKIEKMTARDPKTPYSLSSVDEDYLKTLKNIGPGAKDALPYLNELLRKVARPHEKQIVGQTIAAIRG